MDELLFKIYELEDNDKFKEAFMAYDILYLENRYDYTLWKHFYFFIWIAIEDAPNSFQNMVDLKKKLKMLFFEGKEHFYDKADFNFIAGYTVSIFPYEYGDYEYFEREGNQMLLKAIELDPENVIYRVVYLGSLNSISSLQEFVQKKRDLILVVLEKFNSAGYLNKYFKNLLIALINSPSGKNTS